MPMPIHPRSLLLFAVLLAACGSDGSDGSDDAARPALPDSAAPAAAVADTARRDTAQAAARGPSAVALTSDGLELIVDGAPRRLAFGGAQGSVIAEVAGVLGEPRGQGMQEECPAGPLYQVSYAEGLQLNFQDSAFVGWFASAGSPLRTARSIGPGSTLGQLRAAYPGTTVEETSLGFEFAASELYGVVTDTTAAGAVEVIFAGTNCIFR